jgi:hydrogenase maturation protease
MLRADGGSFVSLTDPPPALRDAAAACQNVGLWPVLVGAEGRRDTMFASPIILSDYPEIAPESPGDLFDGGEIDRLLILNVLSLSEAEQDEMRATDPRAREILERCAALGPEELLALHRGRLTGLPAE